jgi:hypothetical protein
VTPLVTPPSRLARAVVAAAVLVAAGCVNTTHRREDTLVRQARTFNDDWRWSRWDAMTAAMPREDAAAFRARVEAIEDELMLADFEVTSVTFAPESNAATVVARLEWYYKRDPILRHTTVEETWEQRDGTWKVVKLRRTRGDRFGLVTEPIASPDAGPTSPDGV